MVFFFVLFIDKIEEKSASAKTIVLKAEEVKTESLRNNIGETNLRSGEEDDDDELEDAAELEGAATKIQAVFRGHQTRKTMKQAERANVSVPEPEPTQEQLEAEFRADDKGGSNFSKLYYF